MELTQAERVVIHRAVMAYRAAEHKSRKGPFVGATADQILEELHPTPVRWVELASLVIASARGGLEGR
jgi:hypothetical protein